MNFPSTRTMILSFTCTIIIPPALEQTMEDNGIAMVAAGKLPCKHVIFVDTKYKAWEWKPVIAECLKLVEDFKLKSIAFPALGTSK